MKLMSANINGNFIGFINYINKDNQFQNKKIENLDIIFIQEFRIKSNNDKNNFKKLAENEGYNFFEFIECMDMSKDYGKGKLQEEQIFEGLAILSKIPFSTKKINLPTIIGKDRWPRVCVMHSFRKQKDNYNLKICNLHLSKNEASREKQIEALPKSNIYIGDFNMFPEEFNKFFSKYENTYSFKKYISFPSKKQTLDYGVFLKSKIKNVKIVENDISDHSFLIIEI